jgi:nidogen-like/uncharacterized protein DUF11/Big-like domain-containing protein/List-Bact-rpt repeat protein
MRGFIMRRTVILATLILSSAFVARAQAPNMIAKTGAGETKPSISQKSVSIPLFFEANQGQTDSRVKFLTRGSGYTLFMTPTETVLAESGTRMIGNKEGFGAAPEFKSVPAGALRMQLIGANPAPPMTGNEELPGKLNYLMGNDPAQWHTGVPLFSRVQVKQVYPDVDLVFHGNERALEYDFVVAPGADPNQVAFRIRGAKRIEIDSRGDLVLHTAASEFRMHKPVIYQADGASRKAVDGGFILSAKNEVRFQLGAYDRTQELVIDPAIGFSSFLGGAGVDIGNGFVVDDSTPGSPKLYISGVTSDSTSFTEPNTVIGSGTSTTAPIVTEVGFVAKIDPKATGAASLIYLTFIGGKVPFQAADGGCSSGVIWLALDKTQGAANVQPVLGAQTNCSDYPTTTTINPVTAPSQSDIAVVATRLTASGGAVDKSVLIGGNDQVSGSFVSVGIGGEVLIAGATSATNLPVKNAYVGTLNNGNAGFADCFVAKLERSDLAATYLTYTNTGGGSTKIKSSGCGAFDDSSGNILAGGNTISATAFNLGPGGASLANGFEPTFPANATEATWAIKLNPNLSGINQLVFATYFAGGGKTRATNGAFDLGNGVVAIVGRTNSNTTVGDIPIKHAFQTQNKAAANNGQTGYLVVGDTTKTGAASLLCSTYFGGSSGNDIVGGVGYDAGDPTNFRILLSGQTSSTDFPVMNEIQPYVGASGSPDGFVSVLNVPLPGQAFAASLVFSTYIGGSNPPAQINTVPPTIVEDDRITGVGVDSNHTIYAVGSTNSPQGFFANTNPATTVNGFQTACASCTGATAFDDVVIFSIKTGGSATLDSIAVTPTAATIATGQSQQFHAVGNYSDGTEQDLTNTVAWSTVPGGIATMSTVTPGLAMGVAPGVTAVTPTLGSTPVLNNGSLTVTGSAAATHFLVSAPAAATAGTPINFTVTAQDAANNTVTTYPGTVNFSSTDAAATLPSSDVGLTNGVGNFQATLNTAGPQTITVKDSGTASINGTSGSIAVSAAGGAALAITKSALANVAVGQTFTYTINVKNNGPQNATGVTMSDPVPGNLSPTMVVASEICTRLVNIGTGATTLSCAIGALANGASTTITFNVTPTIVGTLTNTATVTGTNNTNTTTNSATVNTTVGGVVGPTLVSIDISPTNPTLGPGQVLQLTAQGNFSDGSTQSLTTSATWATSSQTVATVSNATATQGQLTGVAGGTVTITATSAGVTGQAFTTVTSNPFMVPPQLFFTEPTVGTQTPSQRTTFTNPGPGTVQISGITVTGSIPGDFTQNHDCNLTVVVSGTCPVDASFKPTALGPRTADVSVASNSGASPTVAHLTGNGSIRQLPGFTSNVLPPNDDSSTGSVTLPFTINFFGTNFNSLFVNNNGNVTFGQALSTFTPSGLNSNNGGIPIIAPFWADVDTTGGGSSVVTYGNDTVNGRAAFGVDYQNVGYFASHSDKLNSFQLVLIDRSDTGAGNFDIEFNFDKVQWEVGDASGGVGGLCGALPLTQCTPAAVGYSNGTGNPGTNFQLPGSFVAGALLDGGPAATSLIANDLSNPTLGRYLFSVRSGAVQTNKLTLMLAGAGTGTVKDNTGQLTCSDTSGGQRTCNVNYPTGTQLVLTATADTGSTFTGWDAPPPCSGTGTCIFTITQDTNITATFTSGSVTLQSITVAPTMASIAVGAMQPFTATGHFSDGSTGPVTVTWSSGNTAIATINANSGVATGVTAGGPITITATSTQTPGIMGTAQLTVTVQVTLVSIAVTPANPTVVVGQNQQFTATGTFSDGTKQDLTASVVWASSNTESATITAGGLATGVIGGTNTTISATKAQGNTNIVGSTTLTVTTVPFVLTITPPPGGTQGTPFTVTPGGTLAVGLVLSATPGFSGTVTFSCVSDKPQFLTCAPAPNSVTLSGNTPKQVAIVMNTFCKGETPMYGPGPGGFGGGLALLLAAAMLGSIAWAYRTRPQWALSFAMLMLIALGGVACSGPASGPAGRTPAGNYTLNITATTAGGSSQTVQVPIQVTN